MYEFAKTEQLRLFNIKYLPLAMKSLKPKLTGNTPVRARDIGYNCQPITLRSPTTPSRQNKQNSSYTAQQELGSGKAGLSPNKLATNRRSLLTPKNQHSQPRTTPYLQQAASVSQYWKFSRVNQYRPSMPSNSLRQCSNHSDKEAEFRIIIEGEPMEYCAKCSAHLASQGFPVQKLNERLSSVKKSSFCVGNEMLQTQQTPNLDPSIRCHPRYSQILAFLSSISRTSQQFLHNTSVLSKIPAHYKQQLDLLGQFYDAMIDYMVHVKSQHINLVKAEFRRYMQIGEIERREAEESLTELQYIVGDMQGNITSIVTDIAEDNYRECLRCYQKKVEEYMSRAEQQAKLLAGATNLGQEELSFKLEQFKSAVVEIFGIKESTGSRQSEVAYKQQSTVNNNLNAQLQRHSSLGCFQEFAENSHYKSRQECLPDQPTRKR